LTRIIHLDEHVSRVQSSVLDLLDSPGCNLLLLSDVQVAVLAQMTFPYAWWSTRLVEDHESYQVAVDFPQLYKDELECLELVLSGGATMTCDLSVVLAELAAAIRNQPAGSTGCAGPGPAAILNCVSSMTPDELIPQTPQDAPEYGVPPPGFDTWEEYLIHKCKAAYAIVDAVAGLFGALAIAPIVIISLQAISVLLTGYVGGIALGDTVFPPAVLVEIVAGAVALGLLASGVFIYLAQVQQYILARKDELACVLYQSGSAAQAQAGIAVVVEDAIQSVAWAQIFGPVVGGQVAAGLAAIAGQAETNNLVNPLFRVVEDFVYPDVDCSSCGGEPPEAWHFDSDEELWEFSVIENEGDDVTGSWISGVTEPDPSDSSAGQLQCLIDKPSPPGLGTYGIWTYEYPYGDVPEVAEGDSLKVDLYCSRQQAAEFTVRVNYTDATYSQTFVPNPSGWSERVVAATPGKFVASLAVWFGVGEDAELHDFRMDRARWGQ